MGIGTILLYLTLALGVASVVVSLLSLHTRRETYRRFARYLIALCFLSLTVAFSLLVFYFLVSDLRIEYVHEYTHRSYGWEYKLSGVWAGEKGTILLWTWFISLSIFVEELLQYRRMRKTVRGSDGVFVYDCVRSISLILLVAFISLSIYVDIFTETNSVALVLFPDGQGLNPLLLTPLMVFHPPLEFAAYALITIPFASALSFLITGKKDWVDVSLLWSRLSWLFLTVAMGIGALWAYTVLGWGGYWGWDPVEVSNLLPWIALTAFAHTQSYYKKRNQYPFVSPLLAVLAFVLVIFATFETRTGLVISPLHAFVGPGGGVEDPAERLIAIMNGNPVASYFMMLMIASLIFAGILFLWRFAKIREKEGLRKGPILWFAYIYITFLFILLIYAIASTPSFISFSLTIASAVGAGKEGIGLVILCLLLIGIPVVWIVLTSREKEESGRTLTLEDIINDKNTMILSVTILSIWFITTFLLMIIGAGGLQPYVFESRLPLILVPLSITLVVCLVWRYLGRNVAVYTAIGLIMAALLGYAILSNKMFGAYVAVVLAALVASFYRLLKIASGRRRIGMHRLSLSGLFLVLAGTIGIVFWTNLTRTTFLSLDIKPSISLAILGFLASSIALTAGLSCTRNTAPKLCVIGSFCGILSFGFFFVGTILSIVSLILILTSYSSFLKTGNSLRSLKTMFRATSPHLIHLGIMLLLLGYVASTTMSAEKDFKPYSNPMIKGSSASFEGYELKLVDSEGKDLDGDGTYESIDSVVEISHSGSYLGRAVLRMHWMVPTYGAGDPHYMLDVSVENTYFEDLYFIGYAFYANTTDGMPDYIFAHDERGMKFTSDDVEAVGLQVKKLPLMNALWGGLWLMTLGIFLLVIVGYPPTLRKLEEKEELKVLEKEKVEVDERKYERMLEEELLKLEEKE